MRLLMKAGALGTGVIGPMSRVESTMLAGNTEGLAPQCDGKNFKEFGIVSHVGFSSLTKP